MRAPWSRSRLPSAPAGASAKQSGVSKIMDGEARANRFSTAAIVRAIAVWGPGLLVMLADTDAGNVVTAAQGGAQRGYRLLPLVLVLIPMLYMVQELTVRLGLYTGRG